MQYYIRNESGKLGPFEVSELRSHGLTKNTMVYSKALLEWTKANEVLELIDLVAESPVPFEKSIIQLMSETGNTF